MLAGGKSQQQITKGSAERQGMKAGTMVFLIGKPRFPGDGGGPADQDEAVTWARRLAVAGLGRWSHLAHVADRLNSW
jgi:hypothetical protein